MSSRVTGYGVGQAKQDIAPIPTVNNGTPTNIKIFDFGQLIFNPNTITWYIYSGDHLFIPVVSGAGDVLSITATTPLTASSPTGNVNLSLQVPLLGAYGGTGISNPGLTINLASGVSGYVLTSDSLGNGTWQPTSASVVETITTNSGVATSVSNNIYVQGGTTGLTTIASMTNHVDLTGVLLLSNGGTSANLSPSNGGIFYSTTTTGAILPGTATARQMLQSGAASAPAWSTSTWPATTAANNLLYSSALNTVSQITSSPNGVLISDNSSVPSWLANSGTPGFVLTANSGAPPTWAAAAGTSVTFGADTGTPFSGDTVTIYADVAAFHCGATVSFDATTPNITLSVSNSGSTLIGQGCGVNWISSSGTGNTGLGAGCLPSLTSGSFNTCVGFACGLQIMTASPMTCMGHSAGSGLVAGNNTVALGDNTLTSCDASNTIAVGSFSGNNLSSNESSNILIGAFGNGGQSNSIHIGDVWTVGLTTCYIGGIAGATFTGGSPTPQSVVIDTSTGQLIASSSSGTSWSDQSTSFNAVSGNGYFCTATLTATLPATPSEGDIVEIVNVSGGSVVIAANAGQTIQLFTGNQSTWTSPGTGYTMALRYWTAGTLWVETSINGTWT